MGKCSNVLQSSGFARIKFFNCVSSRQNKRPNPSLFWAVGSYLLFTFQDPTYSFSFNCDGGDFLGSLGLFLQACFLEGKARFVQEMGGNELAVDIGAQNMAHFRARRNGKKGEIVEKEK